MSPADPTPKDEESFGDKIVRVAVAFENVIFGAPKVSPSPPTNLRVIELSPTHLTLSWKASATGTEPIEYTVFIKKSSAEYWSVGSVTSATTAVVNGLVPGSLYFLEVLAHNN